MGCSCHMVHIVHIDIVLLRCIHLSVDIESRPLHDNFPSILGHTHHSVCVMIVSQHIDCHNMFFPHSFESKHHNGPGCCVLMCIVHYNMRLLLCMFVHTDHSVVYRYSAAHKRLRNRLCCLHTQLHNCRSVRCSAASKYTSRHSPLCPLDMLLVWGDSSNWKGT